MRAPTTFVALERIVYQARDLGNVVRALELAGDAWRKASDRKSSTDAELRAHLRDLASWAASLLGSEHDARQTLERLRLPSSLLASLGVAGVAPTAPSGGGGPAIGLLLLDSVGSGEALVAKLERGSGLSREERHPSRLGEAARRALENAETAVLRWLAARHRLEAARLSPDQGFVISGPPAVEWAVDGHSIGLAAALTVFAAATGSELPSDVYATGALSADGRVEPVGGVRQKVRSALRERPTLRLLLVPGGQEPAGVDDARVMSVSNLAEAVELVFGDEALERWPESGVNIEALLRRGVELYEKAARFDEAEVVLAATLTAIAARREARGDGSLHVADEVVARWRRASVLVHRGEVEAALTAFAAAMPLATKLWEARTLDASTFLGLHNSYAVALRDAFRYAEADALLTTTLAAQDSLRVGERERARALGNRGELRGFVGRYDEACADLEASRAALVRSYPDELPRAECYLGNLELSAGEPETALTHYDAGLAANENVQTGAERNAAFLRYGRARALLALSRHDEARAEADRAMEAGGLYPGRLAHAVRGRAAWALGDREAGKADLIAAAQTDDIDGSLLAFGCALARAHLALALLDEADADEDHEGDVAALLAPLRSALTALAHPAGETHLDGLKRALDADDVATLRNVLSGIVALFPY